MERNQRKGCGSVRPPRVVTLAVIVLSAGCVPGATPSLSTRDEGPQATAVTEVTDAVDDAHPIFDAAEPARVDVRLAPEAWEAMRLDLAAILGPFGGRGAPPAPLVAACDGALPETACRVEVAEWAIEGACSPSQDGPLTCMRAHDDGFIDPVPARPLEVEGSVVLAGRSYDGVGVRFKGNSTLANAWRSGIDKLPIRLDFDTDSHPGRTFFGAEQLALGNGARDPSMLREQLAADTLRASGVPAPRVGFVRVHLDVGSGSAFAGLFSFAEVPSARAAARAFGLDDGAIWEADGPAATLERWSPTSFEPQGEANDAELADAIAALAGSPSDAWLEGARARWDIDGFLRWLAGNTALQNWDAYGVIPHNYYVFVGDDGVARFLPWDLNEALKPSSNAPDLALSTVSARWRLIRPVLDTAAGAAAFEAALDAFAAAEGPLGEGFEARLEDAAAFVAPALAEEAPDRTFTSEAAFAAEVEALRNFAKARREAVRAR
jgi:spore coat protein H